MKTLLRLIVLVLIVCVGAWALNKYTGLITLTWLGYEIQISVFNFVVLALVALLAFRLITFPWRCARWLRNAFRKNKDNEKDRFIAQALTVALSDNETYKAVQAKRTDKFFATHTPANLLFKALLAPTPDVYRQLEAFPETDLVSWKYQLEQEIRLGRFVSAQEILERALLKYKHVPWLLKTAVTIYTYNQVWNKALDALNTLHKLKAIPAKRFTEQKALLLFDMGQVKAAFATAPYLPPIALAWAKQNPKKAAQILQKSWDACPSIEVYRAYMNSLGRLEPQAYYKRAEQFTAKAPNSRLGFFVRAEAALEAGFYRQAREELDAYLTHYTLSVPVALLFAELEDKENPTSEKAMVWTQKAKTAEPLTSHHCQVCGHPTSEYVSVCPQCHNFGECV